MTEPSRDEPLDWLLGLATSQEPGDRAGRATEEAATVESTRQALATLAARPSGALRERLLRAVNADNPALTYVPQAAAFLEVSETQAERVLTEAALPPEKWPLNPVPGVYVTPVDSGLAEPAYAFLLLLAGHAEIPRHGHSADEWGLILKGQLADDLGALKSAGDIVYRSPQQEHRAWNPGATPTVFLNLLFGPQRWL